MRYFIDTEFNGFQGKLITMALVAEDGREVYVQVPRAADDLLDPWVAKHVMPFIDGTDDIIAKPAKPVQTRTASVMIGMFLAADPEPIVIADWPEDLAFLSQILVLSPGTMFPLPQLQMVYMEMPAFSSATMSQVPHNALCDARALRDFIMGHDEPPTMQVTAPLVDMSEDESDIAHP